MLGWLRHGIQSGSRSACSLALYVWEPWRDRAPIVKGLAGVGCGRRRLSGVRRAVRGQRLPAASGDGAGVASRAPETSAYCMCRICT